MEHNSRLASKLNGYADELAAGMDRMKEVFDAQDVELANAYEAACIAKTDQEFKEAWDQVLAIQKEHDEKLDTIAGWLENGNEKVVGEYFDSLKA